MLETKIFEVRDSCTFIPVIAIKLDAETPEERGLLRCAGFGPGAAPFILLSRLEGGELKYDPYDHHAEPEAPKWNPDQYQKLTRTMKVAHQYIYQNFDELQPGQVIDVQYILGETDRPKKSEVFERL